MTNDEWMWLAIRVAAVVYFARLFYEQITDLL